ncbi:phosphatase PAP2 family protein [Variovorax sp. LARHSF232]
MPSHVFIRRRNWTAVALLGLLAWEASGLDLPLAQIFATPAGFALHGNWFLVQVMHEDAKALSGLLALLLVAGIFLPHGFLRRLDTGERTQLALGVIASALLVSLIKHHSHTSCPWDAEAFGGVARHVSHWAWGQGDGGPGHCFPAGHASAGFAFLSCYFVLARHLPRLARRWLLAAGMAGLLLGLAQQARGAHYMSHTLWTAWLCWTAGLAIDTACRALRARAAKPAAPPAVIARDAH